MIFPEIFVLAEVPPCMRHGSERDPASSSRSYAAQLSNYDTTLIVFTSRGVMESTQEPVRQARRRAMLATTDDEKRRVYEEMMKRAGCVQACHSSDCCWDPSTRDALFADEYIRRMPSYLTSSAVANGKVRTGRRTRSERSISHSWQAPGHRALQ